MEEVLKGAASKVSRLHFTLTLNKEGTVSLVDHSMNGTWVGGLRIGKGKVFCLQHCQVSCDHLLLPKQFYETIDFTIA